MKKLISMALVVLMVLACCAFASAEASHKFGLLLYSQSDEATISIRTGVENAAAAAGVELVTFIVDGDYQKIPTYLQMFKDQGCDGVIDAVWNAEQGLTTSAMCKDMGLPLITCDVEYDEYAHLVGANNYGAGQTNGEYVVNMINEEWGGQIDWVLAMYGFNTGEGVRQRLMGCLDTLEAEGLLPDEDHVLWFDASNTEAAYNFVLPWLQGNPDASHIYIINNNDSGALGSYNAVQLQGRDADCLITSYNCDTFAVEHFATTEPDCWRASCNFNLGGYGDIAVPALLKILETGDNDCVDHELNTHLFMIDRANAAEYFTPAN